MKKQNIGTQIKDLQTQNNKPFYKEILNSLQIPDVSPEPMLITDTNVKICYVNAAWEKLTGYTFQEVKGKNPSLLNSGKTKKRIYKLLWQALSEGKSFSTDEIRDRRKDGTDYQIHSTFFPIRKNNKNIFYVQMLHDITENNALIKALHEKEEMLESIVNNVYKYAIFMLDKKGYIKTWNSAAQKVFGYNSNEITGKHIAIFYSKEDIKRKKPQKILKLAADKGKYEEESLRIKKDGSSYWAHVVITPIKSKKGALQGFVKITSDITERKELEKQKDTFIGIASHELKTPITSLSAYVQLLERNLKRNHDRKDMYFISNILSQTERLTVLIDDLLHVSRIQSGKMDMQFEETDLNKLIKNVLIDFQYTTDSHEILKEGVLQERVICDQNRIQQVVTNFLTNAIKYSPNAHKIIVHLSKVKNNAVISVQDFGSGIAKEDMPNIFTRFFRTKEKEKGKVKGFGLGLYISSEIIKRHKGKIWVESELGKGSTFYFSLPIKT